MLKILENELEHLKQVEKEIEKTIKNAPEGTVRCSSCKGSYQYYQGKEYISKEKKEYIKQLAQKTYCISLKSKVEKLQTNIERILKIYRDEELENWNRKVIIYPDFTALNRRTGKRWIIEHFGMMDNPEYYENTMFKLDTYEKNGILLGDGFMILHETSHSPLNTNIMKKYIERYLL